ETGRLGEDLLRRPVAPSPRRPVTLMLSLRVKFTLYYLAIISAVLLLFGSSIYAYLSRSLQMTIDEALAYQLKKIEHNMAASSGAELSDHSALTNEDEGQLLQISPHITQIIDSQGRVTDEMISPKYVQLPVDLEKLRSLEPGSNHFETVKLNDGRLLRVATRRVKDHHDNGSYYIRLGQSLEPLSIARQRLLIILGLAIPLALLLGSYGGLLLANQALRPVDRITRAAEQISTGDLTERVPMPAKMDEIGRLVVTFNQMISRLQAAFERQRQFTSDASHELRTPLAVMRGDIEITLRRERTPEEYKRVLTSNLEEIVRLSRLVEDLLMLARADAGRVELRREPVDLNKLCQQMVEYISPLAQQKGQQLIYEPSNGSSEIKIDADMQRIKQLLLNLLDNAIKYTDYGGNVTLRLKTEDKCVEISVADTGRGIPPEDLPHIFERFFRKSKSTSDRSATGFGLGLSIVKWIVDSHGGKIAAYSEAGKGTTFTVRFPLLQA
ncbi:MAG: heavy metal sensor histidine kinase, partial [Acidobacteria bacterium]|nr:heavy metal sensor histidine kinase [Acidobacteriota bacterium]